jgi:hypothetical protein
VTARLDDLRVQAGYWREKHDLYRAKAYGPRPTSPVRLRELERMARAAEDRLQSAEAAEAQRALIASASARARDSGASTP